MSFLLSKQAYGYMRAPWVLNPSPYISRYAFDWDTYLGYLPSCEDDYEVLAYTSLTINFYWLSIGAHGSAHTTYGGMFGCD